MFSANLLLNLVHSQKSANAVHFLLNDLRKLSLILFFFSVQFLKLVYAGIANHAFSHPLHGLDLEGKMPGKRRGGSTTEDTLVMSSDHMLYQYFLIHLIFVRDVDKRIVSLPEIRETGEYIAELKLHPEVTARVRLIVYAN